MTTDTKDTTLTGQAFDEFLEGQLADPSFKAGFEKKLAKVRSIAEVLQVIKKLAEEGRTMVMVTHEMALARDISSEVIFLHKGLVEERGAPEIVMKNPESPRLRQFLQMA